MKLEELVDEKKLEKRLRRKCEDSLEGGCDFDLDECDECDHMKSLIEGAHVFAEELNIKYLFKSNARSALVEVPEEGATLLTAWKPC